MRLLWSISAQTGVALKLTANRRFVDTDLICDGALRQTRFLQGINLVTLALSEAVIGSHLCSFTLDGERHLGIAASRIIPWVKLHWKVESAKNRAEAAYRRGDQLERRRELMAAWSEYIEKQQSKTDAS
jgi:hypothetical protein